VFSTSSGASSWSTVFTGEDSVWNLSYLVCRLDGYFWPTPDGAMACRTT